jgi:hypothetical protein
MEDMYSILANHILKLDFFITKQKLFYKLYEQTRQHH